MSLKTIHLIEELAANAWRAEIEQYLDGWRMRYNQGVNRRTNSVWPNTSTGRMEIEEKLEQVEAFYQRHNIIPRFQITKAAQPENLPDILEQRGYTPDAHTNVQTAPLQTVLDNTAPNTAFTPAIHETFADEWFSAYRALENLDDHTAAMRTGTLKRIGPRRAFTLLKDQDKTIAVGLGVAERGWVGIFCMSTHPDHRRQGAANHILHAIANWAKNRSAENCYLQVMQNNAPALALYNKVGFETLYHYYYAEKT